MAIITDKKILKQIDLLLKSYNKYAKLVVEHQKMNKELELLIDGIYGENQWQSIDFNLKTIVTNEEAEKDATTLKNPKYVEPNE